MDTIQLQKWIKYFKWGIYTLSVNGSILKKNKHKNQGRKAKGRDVGHRSAKTQKEGHTEGTEQAKKKYLPLI